MNFNEILDKCNFSMLEGKIDGRILAALSLMEIDKPTPIQAKTLPHLLHGKDLIGAAKTGSGKTLAFLIPVIDNLVRLGYNKKRGTGCLILSPTRELALQTFEVLKKLLIKIDLSYSLIIGGEKKAKDLKSLKAAPNIIVSTPGRLLDHLQNTESFNCNILQCVVIDEADKLLEAGFEKHIKGIMKLLPKLAPLCSGVEGKSDGVMTALEIFLLSPQRWQHILGPVVADVSDYDDRLPSENRQTILFSATIDDKVRNLAKLTLRCDPVLISIKDELQSTVTGLQQGYYICTLDRRIAWLYKMLRKSKKLKVMVFFSSCKSVDFHYEFFRNCKAKVLSIHGKQSQSRRKETYHSFVDAEYGTLFCTDVAARGLDIPRVDWIVQYDPPTDPKEYIHRVGRTARGLNNTGNAVIVLRPEEESFVEFLRHENVFLDKYSFGDPPKEVQDMLQDLVENNGVMKTLARKAYLSFLRCYKAHPLKQVFDIKTLDLELAAKAFGFTEQPHVDFINKSKRKT